MFRIRSLPLPGVALALAASCSSSAPPPDPVSPTDPSQQPSNDSVAVSLGVTVDARGAANEPRLVRAIVPRKALAGMTAEQSARDHLTALTPLWLKHQQPAGLKTQSTQTLRNGASIVRLQQEINGVPIHQGELRVMVQGDGSLAAISGVMRSGAGRTTFRSSPSSALDKVLDAQFGAGRVHPSIVTSPDLKAGWTELTVDSTPKFTVVSARAKREVFFDKGQPLMIHNIELVTTEPGHLEAVKTKGQRFLVADDGRILHTINLIQSDAFVYRAFADTTGVRTPLDGALASFNPHPTGVPDGSVPGPGPYPLVVMDSFNGPRDPWLASNATTTSGNNVFAYADINPPSGLSPGDIQPEVRAGRTLNYRYDLTAEPLATPTQSKAAAVNLFFMNNWLHDWYYDSGFTEATGNAQTDNFGRGGVGGDPLEARAQQNALGGSRDNANMFTPEDGQSPIMQMFLFTGGSESSLTAGASTPRTDVFVTGPTSFDLTGEVVLSVEAGNGLHTACTPVTSAVAGKIGFFEFDGTCGSITAVNNLKAAGAIGVVASINLPGEPAQPLNGSPTANLPGVILGFDDGLAFEATLPQVISIHRATGLEKDGDLDSSVSSHEWGHYLHHRLAVCEITNQCAAMSEGWGDFNALMLMLRETDDRSGTFAEGNYAMTAGGLVSSGFVDAGYFGIRRFPYSTNRAKNGLSLRHIGDDNELPDVATNPGPAGNGNSEVHNAGEVWAESLWEVYNVVLDAHPFDEAHRRMTDYVVAGLLLTPPEATFTEARDAILAAAGALDSDDQLLMAAAFAGRGSGTCAVAPARESFDFTGVVESGTLAAKLETSAATLTDDGVSCDHDGVLDPGESGTLHLTLANSGIIAAENVVVKATTTSPGVTLGKAISVSLLAPQSQIEVAIPVKLALNAPTNGTLDIAITIDGDAGCNTRHLALTLHQRTGIDELAAVSKTDNLETSIVAWTPTGVGAGDTWFRVDDLGNHALFGVDSPFTSDTQLVSPPLVASTTDPLVVSFKHAFDLEAFALFGFFFDGLVLEVSNDAGATWRDVTEVGVDPHYPAVISEDFDNPLLGRPAFSGLNTSFPDFDTLSLNFGTQFAGQTVQIRFRMGTDFCCTGQGYELDDIAVTGITNNPFPGFVPEPTKCVNGTSTRTVTESTVTDLRSKPHTSLSGVALPASE
jgi:hypothetical protein